MLNTNQIALLESWAINSDKSYIKYGIEHYASVGENSFSHSFAGIETITSKDWEILKQEFNVLYKNRDNVFISW